MADEVWRSSGGSRDSGCLSWLLGGAGLLGVLAAGGFLIVCCGCGASWSAFLSFGIRSDFEDMRVAVRQSDLPEAERDAYVRRLELAEDRFDSGEFDPSFTEWIAIEKPFDDVFSDGRVQPSERALLEEAVRKMER